MLPLLCGCAVPVDTKRAELMPASAAKEIVANYAGYDWAQHPYVISYGSGRKYVQYSEIDDVYQDLDGVHLKVEGEIFQCETGGNIFFENLRGEAASKFVTALVALGVRP